jgi:hypothetical protein
MLQAECLVVCLVEWAVWVEWVEWECNTPNTQTKFKKGSFYCPFFLFVLKICDEQSDEQVMNNFLCKSQFKTANVIVVKSSNTHQIFEKHQNKYIVS